jgi:hypothetical protein
MIASPICGSWSKQAGNGRGRNSMIIGQVGIRFAGESATLPTNDDDTTRVRQLSSINQCRNMQRT